jgi:hypothetical protein
MAPAAQRAARGASVGKIPRGCIQWVLSREAQSGIQAVPSVVSDALKGTRRVLKGAHAPDGATAGTLVVGVAVGKSVGVRIGAGVTTVGEGVGKRVGEGENGTAQRWKVWTARQIGRCEYPRSTPPVEPARRETNAGQCRGPPSVCSGMQPPKGCTRAHTHTPTRTCAHTNMP